MKKRLILALALCAALILSACGAAQKSRVPQADGAETPENVPETPSKSDSDAWFEDAWEEYEGEEGEADPIFAPLVGVWTAEESMGILTVYQNGGFLLDAEETLEGYLVYTEEDGEGLWDSGPRYELYLENNERVPERCFALDGANPGKLVYALGGGAELFSRPDAVYDDSGLVLRALRADERFFATFADVVNFVHDDGEFSAEIAFCAERPLQNFKFLSVSWEDSDEGDDFFAVEELCALDTLTPERPLLVQTSFPGDMPSTGISYTDADGGTKYFAMGESGYDGSLYLSEFQPIETP